MSSNEDNPGSDSELGGEMDSVNPQSQDELFSQTLDDDKPDDDNTQSTAEELSEITPTNQNIGDATMMSITDIPENTSSERTNNENAVEITTD